MSSVCSKCGKPNAKLQCDICQSIYYCNKKCQDDDVDVHELNCSKFKPGEHVSIKLRTYPVWFDGKVEDVLPAKLYRIRIFRFALQISGLGDEEAIPVLQIVEEDQIRKPSKRVAKPSILNSDQNIMNLYLEGRGKQCEIELKVLAKSILTIVNDNVSKTYASEKIDSMTARFIGMEILAYNYQEKFVWKILCFQCGDQNKKCIMKRGSARSFIIRGGGHTLNYTDHDYSLWMFCDQCNTEIHYDDIVYRCLDKQHDLCMTCLYNSKIKECDKLNKYFSKNHDYLDIDCIQLIVEFVHGCIRQFNH